MRTPTANDRDPDGAEGQHTPEPWLVEHDGESARIYSEDYGGVCYLHHDATVAAQDGISHADAARITACVNVCTDIRTDVLEHIVNGTTSSPNQDIFSQYRKQQSRLAALERVAEAAPDAVAILAKFDKIFDRAIDRKTWRIDWGIACQVLDALDALRAALSALDSQRR